MMLAELTPAGFRSLRRHLSPTLLIHQQVLRPNMQRLFRASNHHGMHLLASGGSVVDLYGPKAIFCGEGSTVEACGDEEIQISVATSQLQSPALGEQLLDEIAADFQPRLLMYRLKNHAKVGAAQVDVSEFKFATGRLARALADCFPEDSDLARDTVRLLRAQNELVHEQRFRDVRCAIVEILCALVHHREHKAVNVSELTKDVSTLLQSRGETLQYSAEEVGWKLKELGIPRHTDSSGRKVVLDRDTSRIVHRLAEVYDLPCSQNVEAGCPDCTKRKVSLSE
jgi:hypothetical protein